MKKITNMMVAFLLLLSITCNLQAYKKYGNVNGNETGDEAQTHNFQSPSGSVNEEETTIQLKNNKGDYEPYPARLATPQNRNNESKDSNW